MPEKTIKRRRTEAGARELADDDGPIFSTVAKLVDALQRAVPHSRELELRFVTPSSEGKAFACPRDHSAATKQARCATCSRRTEPRKTIKPKGHRITRRQ
jgi:hypothetical protein